MFDCADDVLAHHDEKVTLPQAERTEMRSRRDANRDRLKNGLAAGGKPAPREFVSQGSYGMKTMTRHSEKDYDVDDGVYFDKGALVGDRGGEMSALQARQMVRDALDDRSFKRAPEVRRNCVRVYYEAGYHVDVPVYRRIAIRNGWGAETFVHELASTDWKRSDARDVTGWFEAENNRQSPDTANGRQLRRLVRHIKKFSRSRDSWSGQILNGFGITKLVTECFRGNASREDVALYSTMVALRDRLSRNLEVVHPVTPNDTITRHQDDARARFLRDRLSEAIETLSPLFTSGCDRVTALKYWDRVFSASFFSDRATPRVRAAESLLKAASAAAAVPPFTFPNAPRFDDKPRGFG